MIRHEIIRDIPLEAGGVLKAAHIVFHTSACQSGKVIWICHALTANSDPEDWWPEMVGPGKTIDTEKSRVICVNMLGSAYGSESPARINPATGEPWLLDFPRVTLVGVIAADMTLNLPDYRSRERTFQLLTQVAGRAGRGEQPGRVIIQTYKPEDPVIGYAAAQDYRAFFEDEFARRRRGLYPPFTLLARFLTESAREASAAAAADRLEQEIRTLIEDHPSWSRKLLLISNDTPSVKVLRGKSRRHVLMKLLVSREADEMIAAMTELARGKFEGAEVWFEVNPTTMM